MLIDMADRFRPVPENIATRPYPEECRTPNCESEAFVFSEPLDDGTLKFHFAVENPQGISAMAMAVILDETLSGRPVDEVARTPSDVIYDFFGRELSMGKSMGLMGMVHMVQKAAERKRGIEASRR
jgi:cysteine desulfuration protein SufE